MRLADGAMAIGRGVLDILLPPHCLSCDQPVGQPGLFCAACFARTGFISDPCCGRCGVPFAHAGAGGAERLCAICAADPPPWGRARAALHYDDQSRPLMLAFKHADRTELAAGLAALMARAGAALLAGCEIIVPVPLHRRRLLARRYNQAALLGRALAGLSGRPALPDALIRRVRTAPLGALSAEERARVVAGAFAVRPRRRSRINGRRVLLVDDVLTSGATCRACTLALLAAGAASVDVLAAARVPDPRQR